ncbi:PilN domain-containing protein [Muricoccus pecuniae]|uniref:Tfp pilus assembly protein PilN n=1 Tax=Muricoccus pecuniae TaxID=693023 RepID=A0A840Y2P0_9PROT|nr:PilN domain-containing protein [Roseomonas pecuniae]MBB5693059.1 Tfp pilus assembly protein PilN [Roseomonas pecuniae]
MTAVATLLSVGNGGSGFLRWWREELSGMLPRSLRPGGPGLVLDLREGRPVLARSGRRGLRPLASFPPAEGGEGRRARRLLATAERVAVVVPSSWILRRVVQLPAAAEARLEAVLGFEVEQHVPFPADEVLMASRILRRLPEVQRIEVEVAVLPRGLVSPLAAGLRALAGTAGLVAMPDPRADWPRIPLNPLAPPGRRWRRHLETALLGLCLLSSLEMARAGLQEHERAVAAVEARAAAARRVAERVLALEADTAGLRARLAAAAQLRGGRPASVAIVEELAGILPDDVWLSELRLTGDQLTVSGFATRSDALLETLDASAIFSEVRFAAPVTRAQREAADRFRIGLRVVPPAEAPKPQQREPAG